MAETAELDLDFSQLEDERDAARLSWLEPSAQRKTEVDLPDRWFGCRLLPQQRSFLFSETRFNVVAAGRRSFKTEGAKRRLVRKAIKSYRYPEGTRFIASAPTYGQAHRIYWKDLKKLVPRSFIVGEPRETSLDINLINGYQISVVGMDKPERVEGPPIGHFLADESANMKPEVWEEHVSPALSETFGTADFIGVPEGRNHFYDLFCAAEADDTGEWKAHHWTAAEALPMYLGSRVDRRMLPDDIRDLPEDILGQILAAREIKSAKGRMDPVSYDQEYNAAFVNFTGRAYYRFDKKVHAAHRLPYQPDRYLIFCFDFNVDPGVAIVCQEFDADFRPGWPAFTGCIGEVHIPKNSNTPAVCNKLIADWSDKHHGVVRIYGDQTGGARSTVMEDGSSNWDIVRVKLRDKFAISFRIPSCNPTQISRVNSMNSRIQAEDGTIALRVDPVRCPNLVKDLDGVQLLEGGSGEIDKKIDLRLTHASDALGYYVSKEYPVRGTREVVMEQY